MIDLKFALQKARSTNYKAILATAKRVGKATGKPWPAVLADLLRCIARYETGYRDYEDFGMYRMSEREKENVLTIGKNSKLCRRLKAAEVRYMLEDKPTFNRIFSQYLRRDWVYLDGTPDGDVAALRRFLAGKDRVIVKPVDQTCGIGISIIDVKDADPEELYRRMLAENTPLLEEVVVQSAKMSALAPYAVNTIRMVSILNGDQVTIVAACLRLGTEGNVVDNFHHGGISVCIDPRTGLMATDGFDKQGNVYVRTPGTDAPLKGQPVPLWDEALAMVRRAARMVPTLRYVGWDVAINQDDQPLLIEGNSLPANDLSQRPELNIGTYGAIKAALGEPF
jgi:hypothetical protein